MGMTTVCKDKLLHHHRLSQFFHTTAWPHQISGQVLSSRSIVSSSKTVRACSPWAVWWIEHWKTTWSTVCSSAPHSQVAEDAIPHLYKQERKRPILMRRQLSWTHTVLGRAIAGEWVAVESRGSRSALQPFHIPLVIRPECHTSVVVRWTMSCCAAGTNECLNWRCCAFSPGWSGEAWVEQVSRLHGRRATRKRGSFATKLSGFHARQDRKIVRWCRTSGVTDSGREASRPPWQAKCKN